MYVLSRYRFPIVFRPLVVVWTVLCGIWGGASGTGEAVSESRETRTMSGDFLELVELAPFEVVDQPLSISVYARTKTDRRYAERFAEDVVDIAVETIDSSTGYGLVIAGDKREPHPMFVYKLFLKLAGENRMDAGLQPAAEELRALIEEWENKIKVDGQEGSGDERINIDLDRLVAAIPLPLEGVASKLYQIAWMESFDEVSVEQRIESLTPAEMAGDELSYFDWVFFLPHRGAFNNVLADIVPYYMEQKQVNIFEAAAIRAALFAFKPFIKSAVERVRKGMLYMTVLRSESGYSESSVNALFEAYVDALSFDDKPSSQSKREFILAAIDKQKKENEYIESHPFVPPEPLDSYDVASYENLAGEYAKRKKVTHRFLIEDGQIYWQYLKRPPRLFLPAGDRRFVSEDRKMTLEFFIDDEGEVTGAMERWENRRNKIHRKR